MKVKLTFSIFSHFFPFFSIFGCFWVLLGGFSLNTEGTEGQFQLFQNPIFFLKIRKNNGYI